MTRTRRVAMISVHTSPLQRPGGGDAGGLNVYVDQTARRLARRGVGVDVFTRAAAPGLPPAVAMEPGYTVRHVPAGPAGPLARADLPAQLCPFAAALLRAAAPGSGRAPYDVIHSHYWLSGLVGLLLRDRWVIPLVHSSHTLAKVKNAAPATGDAPEPAARIVGEEQVAADADLLLAATRVEAAQLTSGYGADPSRVAVVHPGVDVEQFRPAPAEPCSWGEARRPSTADRDRWGVAPGEILLAYAGRIQPHKGPAVLVHAAAEMRRRHPGRAIRVVLAGGSSGEGHREPERLRALASCLGLGDAVRLVPSLAPAELAGLYRAADVVAVPSYSESFGLVALEAQACGTPVVAAAVGGLPDAVRGGHSGLLVRGHDAGDWAAALARIALDPLLRARMASAARAHAERFSWDATVDALLPAYRAAGRGVAGVEVGA